MNKLFVFFGFIALSCASHLPIGYNYESLSATAPQTIQHSLNHQEIHQSAPAVESQKQFYYFNAPQEPVQHHHSVISHTPSILQAPVQKKTQVITINLPAQKVHRRPVQHITTQNVVEDKTHIYVLNKEPIHHTVHRQPQIIQQATVHHHKPEVHFLKYRTSEEADQIQHSIIQQFGGNPSDLIHLGSGSSVSFGSSTGTQHSAPIHNAPSVSFSSTGTQHISAPSREYLAPEPAATSISNDYAKNFLPSGPDVVPGSSYLPPVLRH